MTNLRYPQKLAIPMRKLILQPVLSLSESKCKINVLSESQEAGLTDHAIMLWCPLGNMKQNDTPSIHLFFIHRKGNDILSCMPAAQQSNSNGYPTPGQAPSKASNLIHATQKKKAVLRKNLVSYLYLS